jgi:hypothetical protein
LCCLSCCPFLFAIVLLVLLSLFCWSLGCLSCHFLLVIVLLVLLSFSFGHCVACSFVLFFWSRYQGDN